MTLTRSGPTQRWFEQQSRKALLTNIVIAIVSLVLGFFACEILDLIGEFDVAACSSCAEASQSEITNSI